MRIGVLALQGAFVEHIGILEWLGTDAFPVRLPAELDRVDGLIIPGGESTSILNLMQGFGLVPPLKELARAGLPIWGTCAGMVCLAKKVVDTANSDVETLAAMDIEVRRNAFGRQVDSFETELAIPVLGSEPFHAVFIRAPVIESVGPQVEVLAMLSDGTPVAARQGDLLTTAFHPELGNDLRIHRYFLGIVEARAAAS